MAEPARIFAIHELLWRHATEIHAFAVARGEPLPERLALLVDGDRAALLQRWGQSMVAISTSLAGTGQPYIAAAGEAFAWASLCAISGEAGWSDIDFEELRTAVGRTVIAHGSDLLVAVDRLLALPPERIPASKYFLFWHAADRIYRAQTAHAKQWSYQQIMDYELAALRKHDCFLPLLRQIKEG